MAFNLQTMFQASGSSLAIIFGAVLILAFFRPRPVMAFVIAVLLALLLMVLPFRWLSPFAYINSALGPLSASFFTLCLYCGLALVRQEKVVAFRDEAGFALIIVVLGMLLYGSTFGFFSLPVYNWGFDGANAYLLVAGILVVSLILRSYMLAVWMGMAGLSVTFNLAGSNNLWDHLIDPLAWITCLCLCVAHLFGAIGKPVPFRGLRMSSRP